MCWLANGISVGLFFPEVIFVVQLWLERMLVKPIKKEQKNNKNYKRTSLSDTITVGHTLCAMQKLDLACLQCPSLHASHPVLICVTSNTGESHVTAASTQTGEKRGKERFNLKSPRTLHWNCPSMYKHRTICSSWSFLMLLLFYFLGARYKVMQNKHDEQVAQCLCILLCASSCSFFH